MLPLAKAIQMIDEQKIKGYSWDNMSDRKLSKKQSNALAFTRPTEGMETGEKRTWLYFHAGDTYYKHEEFYAVNAFDNKCVVLYAIH